jgi:hypothetical protein
MVQSLVTTRSQLVKKVQEFLNELADREAIRDCLARFSRAIDRVDFGRSQDLYWSGGTDDHGGFFLGPFEDYFTLAEEVLGKLDVTQHILGNCLIEIRGSTASTETYVVAYHGLTENGRTLNYVGGARYLDKFEKRQDEWRIINRVLVIDWMKNIPDDPSWAEDPIGGHLVGGQRWPDDRSVAHFVT